MKKETLDKANALQRDIENTSIVASRQRTIW